MGFNHDEMTFAPASRAKAAPPTPHPGAMDSAELADQGGWLIGGWSQAVIMKVFFPFLGGGGEVSQSLKLMPQLMMNFSRGSNGFPAVDCN